MQMTDVKRTGTWTFQFVENLTLKQTQMRQSRSVLLVQVRGETSETNSTLRCDALVTSSAIALYSRSKLGAHTTRSICTTPPSLGSPTQKAISHPCCYAALADISACKSNPTLFIPWQGHLPPTTPCMFRLLQQHFPLTHSVQQFGLWSQLELPGRGETVQEISTLSWLSMNDFKGTHRSYLEEISWKCTACIGKLVPVFIL